jgi:hypothetical protein
MKFIESSKLNRFTALIIGEAGIGKTSLVRTIPQSDRAFVLSAEGGLLVVKDLVDQGLISGAEISSVTDLEEAFAVLDSDDYRKNFKWIFIDSLTEIADQCSEQMKILYANNGYEQWGKFQTVMTRLIKGFRDMEHYNVIFTCLPEYDEDELKRRYYAPLFPGKAVKQKLTSYFDYVLYMREFKTAENVPYRAFQTVASEQYPAKARCWYEGQLAPIERPDLSYVYERIITAVSDPETVKS